MSLRNMAVTAALGMTLLFSAGCNSTPPPVKKVASIDQSAIYQMEMFTKADKELDDWAKAEVERRTKELGEEATDEEKAASFREYQLELEKKTNETINPLKEKARAAVANAAKDKGITVILDKKIIVYGVDDLTDDAKTLLTSGGELTYPEDSQAEIDKAPIGYFEPDVVRNLKVFKEAEMEVLQERDRMVRIMSEEMQKAQEEGKQPSPAEIQAMQKQVEARLQSLQQQKMAPLMKAVTDSVEEVAKQEGLSLVLDTQHVMYGGRNLTELVVDSFLKKVGAGLDKPSSDAPSTEATPAPEGE